MKRFSFPKVLWLPICILVLAILMLWYLHARQQVGLRARGELANAYNWMRLNRPKPGWNLTYGGTKLKFEQRQPSKPLGLVVSFKIKSVAIDEGLGLWAATILVQRGKGTMTETAWGTDHVVDASDLGQVKGP